MAPSAGQIMSKILPRPVSLREDFLFLLHRGPYAINSFGYKSRSLEEAHADQPKTGRRRHTGL
jgi:hypothetical protein